MSLSLDVGHTLLLYGIIPPRINHNDSGCHHQIQTLFEWCVSKVIKYGWKKDVRPPHFSEASRICLSPSNLNS